MTERMKFKKGISPKMTHKGHPRVEQHLFLEMILRWHCTINNKEIPYDRLTTQHFINDDENFPDFLMSVQFWCNELGLTHPLNSDVVKNLHLVYPQNKKGVS